MIYVDVVFFVGYVVVFLYCLWLSVKTKEKEFLLWFAATIVFGNEAANLAGDIKAQYEEQPAVKEVRV